MIDRSAYFARINYAGPQDPSIQTLRGLHLAHVLTVPFENLDIHLQVQCRSVTTLRVPLIADVAMSYEKATIRTAFPGRFFDRYMF